MSTIIALTQPVRHSWGQFLASLATHPCADADTRSDLVALLQALSHPRLREFLVRVFEQPQLLSRFMHCPASLGRHHNVPGGLLKHSVSVARRMLGETTFTEDERQVGLVAGLLHDIGKTRVFTPEMSFMPHAGLIKHDAQTLYLCHPGMEWLEQQDAQLAALLGHCWTCLMYGGAASTPCRSRVAKALQAFDGLDSFSDGQVRAFADKPAYQQVTRREIGDDVQVYYRLTSAC